MRIVPIIIALRRLRLGAGDCARTLPVAARAEEVRKVRRFMGGGELENENGEMERANSSSDGARIGRSMLHAALCSSFCQIRRKAFWRQSHQRGTDALSMFVCNARHAVVLRRARL